MYIIWIYGYVYAVGSQQRRRGKPCSSFTGPYHEVATHCNTLQHTATHFPMQHTKSHYTLQYYNKRVPFQWQLRSTGNVLSSKFQNPFFFKKYLDAMRLVLGIPDFLKLKIHRIVMGSRVRIQNLGRQVAYNEQVCRFFVYVSLAEI